MGGQFNVGDRVRRRDESLPTRHVGEVVLPPDSFGYQAIRTEEGAYRLVMPDRYEKAPPEPPELHPRWVRLNRHGNHSASTHLTRDSAHRDASINGWKWIAKVTYSEVEWVGDE